MKIKVYDTAVDEGVVQLKLQQCGSIVEVIAVDKEGRKVRDGYLLTLSSDGIKLCEGVNSELGFPRDEKGRLKVA